MKNTCAYTNEIKNIKQKTELAGIYFVLLAVLSALPDIMAALGLKLLPVHIVAAAAVQLAAIIGVLWAGKEVLRHGIVQLAAGEPCRDSLLAVGSVVIFFHGSYWLIWQAAGNDAAGGAVYFAPLALSVFITLMGRWLTQQAAASDHDEQDKMAAVLVPAAFSIAVIAGLSWRFYSGSNMGWNICAASLLMAYPAALGLARPVSLLRGLAAATAKGVDVKNAAALQNAGKLTLAILCDKGTVTDEKIKLTDVIAIKGSSEQMILNLAVSLTQYETCRDHQLSQALAQVAVDKGVRGDLLCSDFVYEDKAGVRARCQKVKVGLGSENYIKKLCRLPKEAEQHSSQLAAEGKTILYLAADGHLCGIFAFAYLPKENSKEEIICLHNAGLRTMLVTSRSQQEAAHTASQVQLAEYTAGLSPAEQAEFAASIQMGGETAAVIGSTDADAAVMQQGAVSASLRGSQVASDITLKSIDRMADMVAISRKMARIMQQNIFWAIVFNIAGLLPAVGIVYAFGGAVPGVFLLSLVQLLGSLCVMLNSLRLH